MKIPLAWLALLTALASHAGAQICAVPSSAHPTIGAAIVDSACSMVNVAAGVYQENLEINRSVDIAGAGQPVLEGRLRLTAGAQVALDGPRIDGTGSGVSGCWNRLVEVEPGAELEVFNVAAVLDDDLSGSCWLFADGFESAGTQNWSSAVP